MSLDIILGKSDGTSIGISDGISDLTVLGTLIHLKIVVHTYRRVFNDV